MINASDNEANGSASQDVATSFLASLAVVRTDQAAFFASELFWESFHAPFPVPDPAAADRWHQYVAFYRWPDARMEVVGFCNWIRHGDAYLEGGLCVRANFYRRLPKEHFRECSSLGGVAQLMLESAAKQLDDCAAWFGYCGDKKSMIVNLRFGYVPTRFPHLIVKWFARLTDEERERLTTEIALLGPF